MLALVATLVCWALVAAAALVLHAWGRTAVRRQVLVNLGDEAVSGVLWRRRGRLLILRDARMLVPGREPTSMDGEVIIDRDRVQFVQAL